MRRLFLLFVVVFVVPLFGSESPKEYDDTTVNGSIEGIWRLAEVEFDGEKRKPSFPLVLTNQSGTYEITQSDGGKLRGSYRIGKGRNSPEIDWFPSNGPYKGQTVRFIYRIEGDTLKFASTMSTVDAPHGFNDNGTCIETYKRVK